MELKEALAQITTLEGQLTEQKQQNATLQTELDAYKAREAVQQKKAVVQAEIDQAIKDGMPAEAVTDVFRQVLESAADETARKQLFADRRSFVEAQVGRVADNGAARVRQAKKDETKDAELKPEHIKQAIRGEGGTGVYQASLDQMARRQAADKK